jgi:nucleoprotein TPR
MELTRKYEADHAAWASDKKTLEETIVDLSTSDKQSESDRASWEASIREQEERAKVCDFLFMHN